MIRNNLTVDMMQVNVQFLQQLQPEWSRSNATTKYKGKEIAKPITPPSESDSKEDSDQIMLEEIRTSSNSDNKNVDTSPRYKNDNQTGQFGNQRTVTVAGSRETVGNHVVQQSGIQCFNCKEFGHFAKQCRKPKRVKDYSYHKEKMLMCKQAKKGVPLQVEQADWIKVMDEEIDELELEAHYNYMVTIQEDSEQPESISNTCVVEQVDSNVIPDSPDMCDNDIQTDQNAETELETHKTLNDRTVGYDKLEHKLNETLRQLAQKEIDIQEGLKLKAYKILVVKEKHDELVKQRLLTKSHYEGVIHRTNVSRPQLRSSQMKDKVVPNNSQVKFKVEVERPPLDFSIYINKSITACNDSLKSRTSNVNVVCATCGKCVFNSNHETYVSKFLNDVNARAKKPKVVPFSIRKPKTQTNKSVATPPKKIVASESTIQKYKSYFRMIYEKNIQGNIMINRVYYVEGLNHNLFSVGQFYDADLEVAFWKSRCFVRDLQGNDLLTGNRDLDFYTILPSRNDSSTPIYLLAKSLPTQAWLWHRRLSNLNFDYINLLSKKDVVIGLPKLKYVKDQLCSSYEVSKAKISSFKKKAISSSKGRLNLLHMNLCSPMLVASINGKKYILVIVDDYSRYTSTLFLRSKDETPKVVKDFLIMIQRNLQALVISIRTDRGTEFLNKTLNAFFKED
ncbi:retrovirus-related pol polyprotein from transposon TNT 1-94 [Tanacetum coccineum]